jgi:hypothetical protein
VEENSLWGIWDWKKMIVYNKIEIVRWWDKEELGLK